MTISTSARPVLEVRNLKKHFGEVRAVDGLGFTVHTGEIYGLLGPNGAGKTTTIKCILGLLVPTAGTISVIGMDPATKPVQVKSAIGYTSEESTIYKSITPAELLGFIASIRRLDAQMLANRARELLTMLDAVQYFRTPISKLSKGNQQKIQITAALVHAPKLLILDEPLSGLDAKTVRIIKDILAAYANHGGAVVLTTHVMEQAAALCKRTGIINEGRLVVEGSIDDLRTRIGASGDSLEDLYLKYTGESKPAEGIERLMDDLFSGSA
nr:ABC transporter ATP-binding protein [Candidatus Sigynarchaeota archaeon]